MRHTGGVWTLMIGLALGGAVRATVEVGPDGPVIIDVVETEASARHVPAGSLEVVGQDGQILHTIAVPDPRLRSIITPEGGEAALLDRGRIDVIAPWPDGAQTLRLGDSSGRPRAATSTAVEPIATLLQQSGPSESRLDLVFLSDGYREEELQAFADDVDWIVEYLQGVEPYADYATLFNIWRIDVASLESGGDHPEATPATYVDTALDCAYDCADIDRLICCDSTKVMNLVLSSVPDAEGVVVLVNDDVYGGSGGFDFAVSYTGSDQGRQVAAHELGHSLVGLWDEYGYGYPGESEVGANCAPTEDPHWTEWLGSDGIGAHQECSFTTHYRPTENECMMRTLSDDYCAVCRQEVVRAMYRRIPGIIESSQPMAGDMVSDRVTVQTVIPTSRLTFEWWLNGEFVSNKTEFEVPCGDGGELELLVRDETAYVRSDPEGLLEDVAGPWTVPARECDEAAQLCACSSTTGPMPWVVLPLAGLLFRRRTPRQAATDRYTATAANGPR